MKTNKELFDELGEFIESKNCDPAELIAILHRAQHIFGYLPMEVQQFIADKLGINVSKVYGVVTFYSFFTMVPKGKYVIKVCDGTACHVRKSVPVREALEKHLGLGKGKQTTDDMMFTIEIVSCLGACGLAPVMTVNDKVHPKMTPDKAVEIIDELKEGECE